MTNTKDNPVGKITDSLINIINSIESELTSAIGDDRLPLGAKAKQTNNNGIDESVISFTDIDLPEMLKDHLYGALMVIRSADQYAVAINLLNKTNGTSYLVYEVQIGKDTWEAVFNKYGSVIETLS